MIHPLVNYKDEFFINDHYEEEEKAFKAEIELKKKEALDAVNGDKKRLDFDVVRDCYQENVKDYVFDLYIERKNARGELIL